MILKNKECRLKSTIYSNANIFLEENIEFLYNQEVSNNLIIGICNMLKNKISLKENILLHSIREDNKTLLVSIMTPPHDLLIGIGNEIHEDVIEYLINDLINKDIKIPGFLAQKENKKTNKQFKLFREERIYRLNQLQDINLSNGKMRLAVESDTDIVTKWIIEFHNEIQEEIKLENAKKMAENKIKYRNIYLWINNEVVSICSKARETLNGQVVNLVYTPIKYRNKGYASSCVYMLCKEILDSGKKFCSLFTDLGNKTSNNIYSKIGFEPVVDLMHYKLDD